MAIIRKRRIGKRYYYYVEHSYKSGRQVKVISRYLGSKKPGNWEEIRKEMEFNVMRAKWRGLLNAIKKGYVRELKTMPKIAKQKSVEAFMVEFIYNSSKIEGSKLSFKDTAELFIHGSTPKNKPIKDVKEAEGYKNAFYDMIKYKGSLTLKKILDWHKMVFENSEPLIAGKIRKHEIMVTGSRFSFPKPKNLNKLLKWFFLWYRKTNKKYSPVELSALVHLKFVTIHPFTDGNGRISRLISNHILNKNNYPMLNIKFVDRKSYYSSLEHSQLWNDEKHFVRFFIKKYINTNKKYLSK